MGLTMPIMDLQDRHCWKIRIAVMAVKTCESVYTDGCGSNSVSVSSPLRRVPQFFSGSTGVLSGKDWSPFRRGLGKFPYASPGFSLGMAQDVR